MLLTSAVVIWLCVLTVVVLLLVRQLGLVTARIKHLGIEHGRDSLEIGEVVPSSMRTANDYLFLDEKYVVFLSSACFPCRDLVAESGNVVSTEDILVVVEGNDAMADSMRAALLERGLTALGPSESELFTREFDVNATPIALHVDRGIVAGKAYLTKFSDVELLRPPTLIPQLDIVKANALEVTRSGP